MDELLQLNLSYWVLQTVAMLITAWLIPRLRITSIFGAILIVVALAFVNSKVWDTALFLKIPDTLSYQTAMLVLTNGLLFWILIKLLPGIEVDGIIPALIAPIVFSFTSLLISKYGNSIDWVAIFDSIMKILNEIRAYFGITKTELPQEVTQLLLPSGFGK